jgi:hypothetical protein
MLSMGFAVLAMACQGASVATDGGGTGGGRVEDAGGGTDAGGGGAGGGNSDEPVFGSGDVQLFFNDFESYSDLAALYAEWDESGEYGATQSLSPLGGHSGSKAWRITHHVQATYSDTDTVIGHGFNAALPQPRFTVHEIWMKTQPGYPWLRDNAPDQNGAGEKSWIANQGASGTPRMVFSPGDALGLAESQWGGAYLSALPPSHIALLYIFDGSFVTGNSGSYWYFQNSNGASRDPRGYLNDGNWHHYVTRLTPGTFVSGTGGDGSLEQWCDGVKVIEYLGNVASRPEFQQVLIPTGAPAMFFIDLGGPLNGGPSPAQGDQWKDYDDVRIWIRP